MLINFRDWAFAFTDYISIPWLDSQVHFLPGFHCYMEGIMHGKETCTLTYGDVMKNTVPFLHCY